MNQTRHEEDFLKWGDKQNPISKMCMSDGIRALKKNKTQLEKRNKGYSFKLGGQGECNCIESVTLERVHEGAEGKTSQLFGGRACQAKGMVTLGL